MTTVLAGNILAFGSCALAVAFMIAYHVTSRGAWRTNPMGRHMMAFAAVDAAVLGLSCIRAIFGASVDTHWFAALRIVTFFGVPWVFAWRLWLLRSSVRAERARQAQADADESAQT